MAKRERSQRLLCHGANMALYYEQDIQHSRRDNKSLNSYGHNLLTLKPVKDFFIRFAATDKPYSFICPPLKFEAATQIIRTPGYKIQRAMGSNGNFSMRKCSVVIARIEIAETEKWPIPNQLAVPVGMKQKQLRDTSSSSKGKRAKTEIPLQTLLLHADKTLKQAAKALAVSTSTLKRIREEHGFSQWSELRRKRLSEKATHSTFTTSPRDGDVSNTSGLVVSNPSDQYKNWPMPVVLEAGNVDYSAAAYSINDTMFSFQPEMSMQQIQEYGGTQFCFQPQYQSVTTSPPGSNSVSLSRDGYGYFRWSDSGLTILSDKYNLPMPLLAGNVNHSSAPYLVESSLWPDEMLMQQSKVYGGTNDQLGSQTRNQPITTPTPETGMPNRRPVTVLAAYHKKTWKFNLTSESTKEDLEKEVTKRVNLEVGSFYLDYKDEAGMWICIGCNEDLKNCMDSVRSSNRTAVEMLVQLND